MEQKILKDWQKKAISFLISVPEFKNFYLSGGTALAAYYLSHRISDDLDFFSYGEISSILIHELAKKLKSLLGASEMRFSRNYDRNQFFYLLGEDEAKVEFSRYPFQQIKPPRSFSGLAVDDEYDIAVNKLAAILDRFDPKDFVDLYFLLPKYSLAELRRGVETKFGLKSDPIFLGGELSKVRRIAALPKMLKPLTIEHLKEFFTEEIKKLSSEVLQ